MTERLYNGATKEDIIKELREGTPTSVLVKKYNVSYGTVGTWLAKLRETEDIKTQCTEKVFKKNHAEKISLAEARIMNYITPLISDTVSDDEWLEAQEKIQKELQTFAANINNSYIITS